jgi:hypothetical protein
VTGQQESKKRQKRSRRQWWCGEERAEKGRKQKGRRRGHSGKGWHNLSRKEWPTTSLMSLDTAS